MALDFIQLHKQLNAALIYSIFNIVYFRLAEILNIVNIIDRKANAVWSIPGTIALRQHSCIIKCILKVQLLTVGQQYPVFDIKYVYRPKLWNCRLHICSLLTACGGYENAKDAVFVTQAGIDERISTVEVQRTRETPIC